ncbi:MAG: aspartate-semialdehyde dehydrogenase [Chloroflexi bacterium]|mgnify:FL=1|nr:aspartate-semialdehyde dehydrogenase [Chloroflexota bacterium]|tara:strand:- start:3 stop:1037 length:1035 start_codon:yes stop_codon:yes gene_type:complete
MNLNNFPSISIVGATGAVGKICLDILKEKNYPSDKINLFASKRSEGKSIQYFNDKLIVQEAKKDSFDKSDVVFISADKQVSLDLAPSAVKSGALVIDDGSAFRMEKKVPLVVPEVNENDINNHNGIISIPNCTTTPLVMAIHNLKKLGSIERVQATTYQAVSGSGSLAVSELQSQTENIINNKDISISVYPHQIAFSLIPQVDDFMPDGYTKEEHKMINETKKILHDNNLQISATCVRVPVFYCHSEAISVDFENEININDVINVFKNAEGIRLIEDGLNENYPTPEFVEGKNDVYIGRIRKDSSNKKGLNFWIVSDNLRKGAALNAIQIMYSAIKLKKIPNFH